MSPSVLNTDRSDILEILRRRKRLALALFIVSAVSVSLIGLSTNPSAHVQREIILQNPNGGLTFDKVLRLRTTFLKDPSLLQEAVQTISSPRLSPEELKKFIRVKVLQTGSITSGKNQTTEGYRLGLYVKNPDERNALALLDAWSVACFRRIQTINENMDLENIRLKQEELKKQEEMSPWLNVFQWLHSGEFGPSGGLDTDDYVIDDMRMFHPTSNDLGTDLTSYLDYVLDRTRLLEVSWKIEGITSELQAIQDHILRNTQGKLEVELLPDSDIIVRKRDGLIQIGLIAIILGVIMAVWGVSIAEVRNLQKGY